MRILLAFAAACLLATTAHAQAADIYDVYERTVQEDGQITQVMLGQFVARPAPEETLGGHLLALDNQTGRQHLAVQHGAPAPIVEQPEPAAQADTPQS